MSTSEVSVGGSGEIVKRTLIGALQQTSKVKEILSTEKIRNLEQLETTSKPEFSGYHCTWNEFELSFKNNFLPHMIFLLRMAKKIISHNTSQFCRFWGQETLLNFFPIFFRIFLICFFVPPPPLDIKGSRGGGGASMYSPILITDFKIFAFISCFVNTASNIMFLKSLNFQFSNLLGKI